MKFRHACVCVPLRSLPPVALVGQTLWQGVGTDPRNTNATLPHKAASHNVAPTVPERIRIHHSHLPIITRAHRRTARALCTGRTASCQERWRPAHTWFVCTRKSLAGRSNKRACVVIISSHGATPGKRTSPIIPRHFPSAGIGAVRTYLCVPRSGETPVTQRDYTYAHTYLYTKTKHAFTARMYTNKTSSQYSPHAQAGQHARPNAIARRGGADFLRRPYYGVDARLAKHLDHSATEVISKRPS